MKLTQVEKKVSMDRWSIIKFQIMTYCYLNSIHISQHDTSCLTLLCMVGTQTLEDFCDLARTNNIFSSNQSARNALSKAQKKGLITKEGYNKKKISIAPELGIQANGSIVLNYKFYHLQPQLEPNPS